MQCSNNIYVYSIDLQKLLPFSISQHRSQFLMRIIREICICIIYI